MARAQVRTGLPLDTFARLAGISPLHFNGLEHASCGDPILQYGWQMPGSDERIGRIGREDIASAIQIAEETIETWLGFPLVPRWIEQEEHANPTGWGLGWGWGNWFELDQGYYISGGIEQRVVIEEEATVDYSDEDGDGYFETATIGPITTAVLNPNEIALYYPPASMIGVASSDPAWEIRPITVTVDTDAGEVTITCRREQLVLPTIIEAVVDAAALDETERDDDANFLESVDVYRRYNDPQRQVQFLWPNPQCGSCGGSGCAGCTFTTQYGCLRGRDQRLSLVAAGPADWDAEELEFTNVAWLGHGRAHRLRAWYQAGYQDQRKPRPLVEMADKYAQAVTVLAMSNLPGPLCACTARAFEHWSTDLAFQHSTSDGAGGESTSYKAGKRVLENPFGTTLGAKRAWELVYRDKIGEIANYAMR